MIQKIVQLAKIIEINKKSSNEQKNSSNEQNNSSNEPKNSLNEPKIISVSQRMFQMSI